MTNQNAFTKSSPFNDALNDFKDYSTSSEIPLIPSNFPTTACITIFGVYVKKYKKDLKTILKRSQNQKDTKTLEVLESLSNVLTRWHNNLSRHNINLISDDF